MKTIPLYLSRMRLSNIKIEEVQFSGIGFNAFRTQYSYRWHSLRDIIDQECVGVLAY